jgi:hypothetical protein
LGVHHFLLLLISTCGDLPIRWSNMTTKTPPVFYKRKGWVRGMREKGIFFGIWCSQCILYGFIKFKTNSQWFFFIKNVPQVLNMLHFIAHSLPKVLL